VSDCILKENIIIIIITKQFTQISDINHFNIPSPTNYRPIHCRTNNKTIHYIRLMGHITWNETTYQTSPPTELTPHLQE